MCLAEAEKKVKRSAWRGLNSKSYPVLRRQSAGLHMRVYLLHIGASRRVFTLSPDIGRRILMIKTMKHMPNSRERLYLLMGIGSIESICSGLLRGGMPANMPAAVVHRASSPFQKTVVATLETLPQIVKDYDITPPGLIVVGEVVTKRSALNFFENKPLFGKKVIVTRARAQNSQLMARISELGGMPIEMPMINVQSINSDKLVSEIGRLDTYQYVIFTSENGVKIFFDAIQNLGKDARAFGSTKVAAIGIGTAKALRRHGIIADYVPEEFVGEAVVDMLEGVLQPADRVLIPALTKCTNDACGRAKQSLARD